MLDAPDKQAKSVIATEELTAVADRGYYRGEDILACEKANITSYLPKPNTSGNRAKGQYGRNDFRYIAEDDEHYWHKTSHRGYQGIESPFLVAK